MDDIRGSLSKMKKDIKHRLTGKKRKEDKARVGGHGVGVESSGSVPPRSATSDDREREENEPGSDVESVGPDAAADESNWTTTASASAKLVLRGVGSSSDAFGPLKSVAGGLCFILENCEVRLPLHILSVTLTGPAAHEGEQVSDRIVGAQSQDPQRETLSACS